jgi:nitrite reductase/ring-hydroxylating ferredoxin subunit
MSAGTRLVLTGAQRDEIARGRFVRVELACEIDPAQGWARSVVVGRVGGAWRAFDNVCRHRALPLDLGARSPMSDDGRYLLCHQHGALYRPGDGTCIAGPCTGEKLTALSVVEEADGTLVVGA